MNEEHDEEPKFEKVAVHEAVVPAIEELFNTALYLCETTRLCFDFAVLLNALEELEKVRLSHSAILSGLEGREADVVASGLILCRSVEHYLAGLLALKDNRGAQAWAHLVDADERRKESVALAAFQNSVKVLREYEQRLAGLLACGFPVPRSQSSSFEIAELHCNICGDLLLDCDHESGKYYEGKRCTGEANGMRLREVSFVAEPFDRACVLHEFDDGEILVNLYSGVISPSQRRADPKGDPRMSAMGVIARITESSDPTGWASLIPQEVQADA